MNIKLILKIIGALLAFFALTILLPIPVSIYYNDGLWHIYLVLASITSILGFSLFFLFKESVKPSYKDGFAIVSFGWLLVTIIGMVPFIWSDTIPGLVNAFFESMSGFTTTGATIMSNIQAYPKSVLFWRQETQWLGGMGIIVLSVAILPLLGIGGTQLFQNESPGTGLVKDKILPKIADTARALWAIYILFTVLACISLMIAGMDFFQAICHAFTTIATGGFTPHDSSIALFENSSIHWIIITFMFLAGGINFGLHYSALTGKSFFYLKSEELRTCILLFISAIIIIVFTNSYHYDDFFLNLRDATFQVVSLGTSTGYVNSNYELWPFFAQHILLFFMLTGGCAGSTAGGIKIVRLLLIIKHSFNQVFHIVHPKSVRPLTIDKQAIPVSVIQKTLGFFTLYGLLLFGVSLVLTNMGVDFMTAGISVICSLSNIGPGLANIGPTDNYAHLPDLGKILLSICMLIGRLEFFTVLVLFVPSFWKY